MTAIACATPMIAAAPAPATPSNAGSGAANDAAAQGAEGSAFARQLERAQGQGQGKAGGASGTRSDGTRTEGTRKGEAPRGRRDTDAAETASATPLPADAKADPALAAELGLGAEAGVEAAADEDEPASDAPALDLSALLAGWVAPQTAAAPRTPAGHAKEAATDEEAAAPLAAAGRGGRAGEAAAGEAIAAEALPPGDARAPRRADAVPSEPFVLPTALPAGAAGAAGGAALAAPVDAAPPRPPMAEASIATPLGSAGFAPALGAEVSLLVKDGVQEARLHLNPAEMGPITVQIQIDGDRAQVTMSAEQAPTRQALEQALPSLAGALRENGLTLTGGGVFEQPRQPQDGQPGQPGQTARGPGRADGSTDDDGALAAAARAAPARARGVVDLYA